jgi:putative tryptophan/tyrosine transport system substrate-binding protein
VKRREFIGLIGGVATWPVVARAQQADRKRRIGLLLGRFEDDHIANDALIETLRKSLQVIGWSEARNIRIDYRIASDVSRLNGYAAELVNLEPDVIVTESTPATLAVKRATSRIPVVFVNVSNPIGSGLVTSVARPGGMMTGFTNFESSLGGKWVDLLREIAPATERFALMFNPETAASGAAAGVYVESARAAAIHLGSELIVGPVHDDLGIEALFKELSRPPSGGAIVNPNVFTTAHRVTIVEMAARYKVPAIYPYRLHTDIGGLLSYGVDPLEMFRGASTYVDRILKGANPADLPVQAPTKFELVINLKTANALGLNVPTQLQQRADEVIE